MCITSGPAELSKTKIMSIKLDDDYHLLAYSNSVENLSNKPNSMILAVPGTLTQKDFYDTTAYAKFMDEIEEHWPPRSRGLSKGFDSDTLSFENFQLGMYNIFVSDSAHLIGDAISKLSENERPTISSELLNFFQTHYEGWSFVICCFNGNKKVETQPIMFKYKPFDKKMLYFPGMDSHTGGAPDLTKNVRVDHFLISEYNKFPHFEFEENKVPDILKNKHFFGNFEKGRELNGDWYLNTESPIYEMERHTQAQ